MKIEITETIRTKKTIELELPYYYKHDLMMDHCDSIIYGRIDAEHVCSVQLTTAYSDGALSVELQRKQTSWANYSCYLRDEFKSNESEFKKAKATAIEFVRDMDVEYHETDFDCNK